MSNVAQAFLPVFVLVFPIALAMGQDARQIIEKTQQGSKSKSEHYEGTLEVQDPTGKVSIKRWIFDRLGSAGDSKSVLRFTAPAEIKGVALLIVNHPDHSSDQWIWTPAIERERRIAMQDRATRFFGTGFSFEDLEERDVSQFDYKLLGDDTVNRAACWKIESKAKQSKPSQYTSSILWVRKDNYVVVRIENYNQDKLVRSIGYADIERQDNIWTARKIEVLDAGRNSRTVLKIDKLQYNGPMKAEDFTIDALRR
jgi:outer membrane lipoprotein-sorting protein